MKILIQFRCNQISISEVIFDQVLRRLKNCRSFGNTAKPAFSRMLRWEYCGKLAKEKDMQAVWPHLPITTFNLQEKVLSDATTSNLCNRIMWYEITQPKITKSDHNQTRDHEINLSTAPSPPKYMGLAKMPNICAVSAITSYGGRHFPRS